ncbi:hypothetical protein [Undibacterium sp. TJN19]|uniref:hypothetical protein n=1 Tax=Undibacterium sp. TJN19 TaxID=3413055 RepID=UPI003BF096E3
MDDIFEILLQLFGQIIGYGTGRLLIPILSLGSMRGEHFDGETGPDKKSYFWRDDTGIVVSSGTTTFIGIVFWVAVLIAVVVHFNS